MFWTIRDRYDCLLGQYDSRELALSIAEQEDTNVTVFECDVRAIATFNDRLIRHLVPMGD